MRKKHKKVDLKKTQLMICASGKIWDDWDAKQSGKLIDKYFKWLKDFADRTAF